MQHVPVRSCQCSGCGAQHNSPDGGLPVAWSRQRHAAWCPDCTRAGVPVRHARQARRA